jgi:AcrR family transcriptional regulator
MKMSKSTLYKHFASKEALIIALVEEVCGETEDQVRQWVKSADTGAKDSLERLANLWAEHAMRIPRAVILQRRRLPPHCQNRVELTSVGLNRLLREIIGRGVQGGEFVPHDPALTATSFIAASQAAMEGAARGEVAMGRDEAVRAVYSLILSALTMEQTALVAK